MLLQAPCGSGKTVMGSHLIKMRKEHLRETAIVFAHRREIVYQTAQKLADAGLRPEIIMAGVAPDPWANVRVASVDTVWARHKAGEPFPEAQFVVIDEVHRALAPRYIKLIEHYQSAGAILLGLTATPMRNDGVGLGKVFEQMVRAPDIPWLLEHKYLCLPTYRVGVVPDLKGVKLVAGEYNQQELEQVMNQKILIGDIVENWLTHAHNLKTMVFASGVKHSMHLANEFGAVGIKAVHIDGETKPEDRDQVFERTLAGEIQVICNDSVYVEGTDFPWIECLVDAHPTKSLVRYLQSGGRGLRSYPGKEGVLYMDHANNVWQHGRLEIARPWELAEGKEQVEHMARHRRQTEKVQIQCRKCGFLHNQPVCPHCGEPLRMVGRAKEFLPAMLVEMTMGQYAELLEAPHPKPDFPEPRRLLRGIVAVRGVQRSQIGLGGTYLPREVRHLAAVEKYHHPPGANDRNAKLHPLTLDCSRQRPRSSTSRNRTVFCRVLNDRIRTGLHAARPPSFWVLDGELPNSRTRWP